MTLGVHSPLARALATPVLVSPSGARVQGVNFPGAVHGRTKVPSTYDWRAAPGSAMNEARALASLERRPLGEVLTTRFPREAHFTGYVFVQQGDVLERAPRVCKGSLEWLRSEGYDCWTTTFLADVDTPRAVGVKDHRPWDPGLREELAILWARAEGPLATCGIYLSPHGYRLVQPLEEPIPSDEAEPRLRAWLDALKAVGCWSNITVVKDWTRLMRAPFHRRATGYVKPAWADYSRMVPVEPPAAPVVVAQVKRTRPAPKPRALGAAVDTCPSAWVPVAEVVGRTIEARVTERYRDCYLALAGALYEHGCPPEALGAVLARTRQSYAGWETFGENRAQIGEHTALRIASGASYTATAALRRGWPAVAAALAEACATGSLGGGPVPPVVARVRAQLGEARDEVSVEEATKKLRAAILDAYGVVLVAAPPGLGKSEAVLWLAEQLVRIVRRARPGQRIGVTVPTHALAEQLYARAEAKGIAVARLFGPLAHKGADGTPTCIYHDRAEALARGGHSVARLFCDPADGPRCEAFEGCPAREGYEGDGQPNLLIAPHELLSRVRREIGELGTLAIDEPPPMVDVVPLSRDDLEGARRHLDATLAGYAKRMAPALEALLLWARAAEPGERLPLVQALTFGVPLVSERLLAPVTDPLHPDAADVLEEARRATESEGGDRRGLAAPLTPSARRMCRANPARAAEVGAATEVLLALSRALVVYDGVAEAEVTVEGEEDDRRVLLVLPNERMLAAVRRHGAGTVLLDAGIKDHRAAIAKLAGYEPPLLELHVPDGCPVERAVLATLGATRGGLVPRGVPDWTRVAALLRAGLAWAAEDPAALQLVLVTWKSVEAGVLVAAEHPEAPAAAQGARLSARQQRAAREALGALLAPWRGRLFTAHYEALRGLDHLRDADALVTLGDPRRNLGIETARALWIGEEPDGRVDALAASELDQAHGRLRVIHRTKPARMAHLGAIVPSGWRSRDVRVRALSEGRPVNLAAMGAEELLAARGGLGLSVRELARKLGLSDMAVRRYEAGDRGIPELIARAVRALVQGATETP